MEEAVRLIKDSQHMVALTGAGVSQESGIPTFRGTDGLWRQYDVSRLATPDAFETNPSLVWEWYSWRIGLISECRPNRAHITLASWEHRGLLKALITQNVDGLHQAAGSKNVIEVHGSIHHVRCTVCRYRGPTPVQIEGIPVCPECRAYLRPDVVWFGEALDQSILQSVYHHLQSADVCLVIGTSGLVQPAATFPFIVKFLGGHVIEINPDRTPLTDISDVRLAGKAAETMARLDELVTGT
ncbi:MAG: NAD-dependent deacylase [Candidatus Thorarchaeota archaeon]